MGMIQDFQQADKERRAEVKELQREVATMLKEFDEAHNIMSRELKGSLATTVAERKSEVATMLKEFDEAHSVMSKELKDSLATTVAERKSGVAAMLKEFDETRSVMSRELKDSLTTTVAERKSGVATMLKEFDKQFAEECAEEDAIRKSDVAAIHEMVWGKVPAQKMASPAVEELPEEMPPEAPAGALRDRVFAYLADHPDGTKLTELEEAFGVARIQIAKIIRELIDDNKVEKVELLYFAI